MRPTRKSTTWGIAAAAMVLVILLLGFVPRAGTAEDHVTTSEDGVCEGASTGGLSAMDQLRALQPGLTRGLMVGDGELTFGLATEGGFGSPWQWDETAQSVGAEPELIMAYASFVEEVPLAGLESVAARGATPVVTWEPWDPATGSDQSRFALATITRGDSDPYVRRWAETLGSYGKPVILRFAHEMNYPWYPWGMGYGDNTPADYVAAWRHVHGIFEEAGASNVSWMWSPEAPRCRSTLLEELYPGDEYVDLLALDGYNWGTSRDDEQWRSPEEIFGLGLEQVGQLSPDKPILIGETASAEMGGSKAEWITELVAYLAAQPQVEGFVWFDYQKEAPWRITSSEASRRAFEEALDAR